MNISPLAGKPAPSDILVNVPRLISAYYSEKPDVEVAAQQVSFGTSGHRGSSFNCSFNENHILAITQSICLYRKEQQVDGPLFIGMDTHALSVPALASALEVLAANGVTVMTAGMDEYTPTPVISQAILAYNKGRTTGLADGIIITPSHNPPEDGGFKYNPPSGGPAPTSATNWIQAKANELLRGNLKDVKRTTLQKALKANTTHQYDYVNGYINELDKVVDMNLLRDARIRMAVDPLGGAGVHYWEPIAQHYKLDLTVVSKQVDPTFRFMTVDWDGKIRMDPSSPYAMASLIGLKDKFDIAFACDTDHDRHGIVTRSGGLLAPNHYLAVCIHYLFQNRPGWSPNAAVGKTIVSSSMIDRVTASLGRKLYEVPVGFKWFVDGLVDGSLGFVGEESAGASFLRMNGEVWTTDKDGFIPCLLSAEIMAKMGKDPAEIYSDLTREFGNPAYDRKEAPAGPAQKKLLGALSPDKIKITELGGEKVEQIVNSAPGNGAGLGGIKVATKNSWFAARPSGTEDIYKIYGESFEGKEKLEAIFREAQGVVDEALAN
jgi:phosphoglucomutase